MLQLLVHIFTIFIYNKYVVYKAIRGIIQLILILLTFKFSDFINVLGLYEL